MAEEIKVRYATPLSDRERRERTFLLLQRIAHVFPIMDRPKEVIEEWRDEARRLLYD